MEQGLLSHTRLKKVAPIEQRFTDGQSHVGQNVFGLPLRFAQPITFTPFASVRPCTARCTFCSETLVHKDSKRLSQSLRPGPSYFEHLAHVLCSLSEVPLGISLSGLEATDDAEWLTQVLTTFARAEGNGAKYDERVLYSNGSGLSEQTTGCDLLPKLKAFDLTRIEISRHHMVAAKNDRIMRFKADVLVAKQTGFEEMVRFCIAHKHHVRLVCVLQKPGVGTYPELLEYIRWAKTLGVTDIVFREFSRLGSIYKKNRPLALIEEGRVPIEPLVEQALEDDRFKPIKFVDGYYYWNYAALCDGVTVTFETSDYTQMKTQHARIEQDLIQKLVFHANGNLCADWDPDKAILWTPNDR